MYLIKIRFLENISCNSGAGNKDWSSHWPSIIHIRTLKNVPQQSLCRLTFSTFQKLKNLVRFNSFMFCFSNFNFCLIIRYMLFVFTFTMLMLWHSRLFLVPGYLQVSFFSPKFSLILKFTATLKIFTCNLIYHLQILVKILRYNFTINILT